MKKITKIVTIIGIVSSILTNVHAETNELSQVTLDFIKIKLSKEELKKLNLLNESNEEYSSEKIKDNWERIYNYGFLNNVIDAQSFISEPDKNIILKLGNQKYLLESYNKFESENKEFLILDSKIPCLSSEETHLGVHLEISTSFQNNGVYILLSRQEIYIENYDELGFPKINNKEIQTNVFMTNDKPYLIHSYRIKDDFMFYFITSKKVKNKVVDKVKKLKNQVGFKFKKNDEDNEENDNETELYY